MDTFFCGAVLRAVFQVISTMPKSYFMGQKKATSVNAVARVLPKEAPHVHRDQVVAKMVAHLPGVLA